MGTVCSRHSRERSFNRSNKNNNMEIKNMQCVVVVMTVCLVFVHARTLRDDLNLLDEISEIFAEKMEKREDCTDGGYSCSSDGECCSNSCSLGQCRYIDTGGRRDIGIHTGRIGGAEP